MTNMKTTRCHAIALNGRRYASIIEAASKEGVPYWALTFAVRQGQATYTYNGRAFTLEYDELLTRANSLAMQAKGIEGRTARHRPGRDSLLPGACTHRLGHCESRHE